MSDIERTAMAMLKSGLSWEEASTVTGIPIGQLQRLWEARGNSKL